MRILYMHFINTHGLAFTTTSEELKNDSSNMTILEYIMYCLDSGSILVKLEYK